MFLKLLVCHVNDPFLRNNAATCSISHGFKKEPARVWDFNGKFRGVFPSPCISGQQDLITVSEMFLCFVTEASHAEEGFP